MKPFQGAHEELRNINRLVSISASILCLGLQSCGGCGGKSSGSRNVAGTQESPPSTSTGTATQTETSSQSEGNVSEKEKKEDIGEEVPPIKNNEVASIDTSGGGGLKHLVLEAGDGTELGRYLSEYLIVIRAKEASCLKLRFRPSSGINNEVNDEAITPENAASGPCEGNRTIGEQTKAPKGTATATATGTGTGKTLHLQFGAHPLPRDEESEGLALTLAARSLPLCASRIFRMQNRGTAGSKLEPVGTKTGRLAVVQGPIRIWIDEEFTNFCTGGLSLDASPPVPWGPLIQEQAIPTTWADKLWLAHLQNLAAEMERIYQRMTGSFGPISDIDQNSSVEIFISPDINRSNFILYETTSIDHFRALPNFKLEDLALYNSQSNPASNEGEILYLWAPDPGGIYNQVQFPSANSLTTNYAKGYLSFQLFNLIYANEKLFVQKRKKIDEPWLMQSLSLLASAYYAGNDFTVLNLAQYLTSRPQYISLSRDLDTTLIAEAYRPMAADEQAGLRALFGWYLHTRLCGVSPAPCAKLKEILTSKKSNYEVLEEVLGGSFDTVATHFGTSLALGLTENPEASAALFDAGAKKEPRPLLMGNLAEIFSSEPPVTAETENPTPVQILAADPKDATVAGPYPSREMLYAQPVSPESGAEFKIAPDSIVVLQATGLIEKQTDITAYLGSGLKVIFIPLGERDGNRRRIHFEKLSQDAHGDLRPENLTSLQDPHRTYAFGKTYETASFAVNPRKQLWVLGSVDNYKVNIAGSLSEVQDSDAYNIEFRPCATAPDVAACESAGGTYDAIVQLVVKDFEKELAPMLLVTSTDREVFRGRSVLGRMSDVIPGWLEPQEVTRSFQCPGVKFNRTTTVGIAAPGVFTTPSAHGLTNNADVVISSLGGLTAPGLVPYRTYQAQVTSDTTFTLQYQGLAVTLGTPATDTYFLHTNLGSSCNAGQALGAAYYSHRATKLNPQAFAHTYDNFLMLGLRGFPYNNYRSVTYTDAECTGLFCFKPAESVRQHLLFFLVKELRPKTYNVYATNPHYKNPADSPASLTSKQISTLVMLKKEMDSPTCVANRTNDSVFLTECTSVADLTSVECSQFCAKDNNHTAMNAAIVSAMASKSHILICYPGMNCNDIALLMGSGAPPDPTNPNRHSTQWISPLHYNEFKTSTVQKDSLYYPPIEPRFGAHPYCTGEPGSALTHSRECAIRDDSLPAVADIREQFNTTPDRIRFHCDLETPTSQFDLCIDPISVHREFNPEKPYVFAFYGQKRPTDRLRQRRSLIHYRAGELVGKPERVQYAVFQIPATGGVAQVIVGGRNRTQGKYLLRARLTDFDL